MSGIELQMYIQELAAETATAAHEMRAEERQDFVLGKMALLQTYLTSTGLSDGAAFDIVQEFQALVEGQPDESNSKKLESGLV